MDGVLSQPVEMVEKTAVSASSVISSSSVAHPPEDASDVVEALTLEYRHLFGIYASLMRQNPTSDETNQAHLACNAAQERLEHFQQSQATFLKSLNRQPFPAPVSSVAPARSVVVPSGLPFLQLIGETQWKPKEESFDSAYDFCASFEKVLRAHAQDMDGNWERLLPMCLNNEQYSWFEEMLMNKGMPWITARSLILDHVDTTYRKFQLMAKIGWMRQGRHESTREYANRFQKLRREAGLDDNTQSALALFSSLREDVRARSQQATASKFGKKLPDTISELVEAVISGSNESDFLAPPTLGKRARMDFDESSSRLSGGPNKATANKGFVPSPSHKSSKYYNKGFGSNGTSSYKPCNYCNEAWVKGHRCDAFRKAKGLSVSSNKEQPISRMALRTSAEEDLPVDEQLHLNRMALECKYSSKDIITKDFKSINDSIVFPILIIRNLKDQVKVMSILDTGANYSSINKDLVKKLNLTINPISNDEQKYIKLADNNSVVKRIGTTKVTLKCNNKTLTRTLEVMELTNGHDLSIGIDLMSYFGIGIIGLPIKHDESISEIDQLAASRRYYNDSELLEQVKKEMDELEDNPASSKEEYNQAMAYIQHFIKANETHTKGKFCTIPESVVNINTPPNVTAYRKPYPVPIAYHNVVDKQIEEWLQSGFIKRASKHSEWNCPITVVPKTNGKGEVTGHRVCHDPRHVNALLQSIDRMPLPLISELFEELKGATIYSTLDLKSAFNSLLLNPEHAHKLNFTWRGVQYTPVGTVFGVKHVSSVMQRTMSIALEGMPFAQCFVDDVVIKSNSIEEHKHHLSLVINKLTEVNLQLQPKKCKFFQNKINLLGFTISPRGISMDRRKLINVLEFPRPRTGKDIMRYTGLISYLRSLIPKVSTLMAPLDALRNEKSLDKIWNNTHETAFNNLKKALLNDTVISYPDFNHPFYVATDASNVGVGTVLYQKINGEIKYISMMAKSLSSSERNYSATKRELLAVVYALKKFHKYLFATHFFLYTDHKALTYLHTQKIANAMMINWLDVILQYDFKVVHLPGIDNILPDTLSRLFEAEEPANELGRDKALCNKRAVLDTLPSEDSGEYMTPADPQERKLLLMREHLKGHFASDAIYYGLKRKGIYWSNLKNDAIELVKSCVSCQQFNIVKKGYNPLRPITATLPGDSWGIDLAGPFKTSLRGNNYLLIMVDIATRYCVLKPIPDKSSLSIVKELVDLMITFGIPRVIQSDNGTEFVNEMMSLLAEHSGFEHRLISAYHPRANGVSERWVQSSVNTIKKQVNGMSADWDLYVGPTQLHLNTKYNERTKTPPFTLMFGRNANDFEDFSKEKDKAKRTEINQQLQDKIKMMSEIVYPAIYKRSLLVAQKQKDSFDKSHKLIDIPIGAEVMVKVLQKNNKLDPNYIGTYKVLRKTKGGSYVLQNEKGQIEPRNYPPSLLKLVNIDPIKSNDKFYDVEAIVSHKKVNGKYIYNVRWKGYTPEDDTWEPAENFIDPRFINEYWKRIGMVPEDLSWKRKYNEVINSKSNTTGKRIISSNPNGLRFRSTTNTNNKNNKETKNKRARRY
jgi:transposase InsO family protein